MLIRTRRAVLRAVLLLAVPAATLALVQGLRSDAGIPADEIAQPDTGLAPGSAAMIARIDPETGVVGVASGSAPLALDPQTIEAISRSTEGLVPVTHPDGSVSVHLQGRFQSASIARLDENGTVIVCSDDHGHAADALNHRGTPALEVQ